MKTLDQTSSLFWLLVSIVVFIESLRLGIGTPHNPGMGFLTLGASGILGILSLVLFLQASVRRKEMKAIPFFASPLWKRVLLVLLGLILYSKFMPVLGYLISTFLLMLVLFWILERRKIGLVIVSSTLATFFTYLVFSKWLNCQFPQGLFGF
ncbi:MAG: tripartite tricarboxylate transporter TctB family protein [Thermodesulfobacteriota bacterium]